MMPYQRLLFDVIYSAIYLAIAVCQVWAWHGVTRRSTTRARLWPTTLAVISIVLWVIGYLGEMTFLGIFSLIPLLLALACAAASAMALQREH